MQLAALFSDHAVLQRGIAIPVWGWTQPLAEVKATLANVAAQTRAGADGRFMLRLPPLAAGGPYCLRVATADHEQFVNDIYIGEVWVASGQSNMEWTLNLCGEQGQEAIAAAAAAPIRMLTVPRLALCGRQSDIVASWKVADAETAGEFSAVAYHFARKLHAELGVVVGIINSSWGGTIVEAWTSRETLVRNADTKAWTERHEANLFSPQFWTAGLPAAKYPVDPGNEGEARGWAGVDDCPDAQWPLMPLPRTWQVHGHSCSGVFWFRRTVELPAAWAGKDLSLNIGAVDKQDITYFNGTKVGATGSGHDEIFWNQPRNYTVAGNLVKAGANVIAVRAYSFIHSGGMIGPESQMWLAPADGSGKAISLAGDWRYCQEHDFGLIQPPTLPMGPGNPNSPYILFDNMIQPLLPYAMRGAIWYQGESNAGNARQYQGMLSAMIRDWRRAWGQGDFPFVLVQLANYMKASNFQQQSNWAHLREAQLATALSEPEVGMAVSIDVGDADDIHPRNKKDVGERLAQWALVKTYGDRGVAGGPIYRRMCIEGTAIRLSFDQCGSGLCACDARSLTHFVIAGADRIFYPATVAIDAGTVLVSSTMVPEPQAVRYAWSDNPEGCNFANRDGFPATPFRTDNW